jgi:glycosyl transferase family 25
MQTYVINLNRRPDRLHAMTAQLEALAMPFLRIEALDAQLASDEDLNRGYASKGPLGVLTKGNKACSQSNRRVWRKLLESGERFGLVLQDDVVLDPGAVELLRSDSWIPQGVDVVKLEHYGPDHQRVLVAESIDVAPERKIARLRSRHTGAGAYILSRQAADVLLHAIPTWQLPIDHMLFNPNSSPLFDILRPYQMLPAVARQSSSLGGLSDLESERIAQRDFSLGYIKRELVRAYNDLRVLPWQLMEVAQHRARLVRVSNKAG